MAHEDINEDFAVEELEDEQGNHSDFAIWTDELTSSSLEKYKKTYLYKGKHPNLFKNMWKIIVDHINVIFTEWSFT